MTSALRNLVKALAMPCSGAQFPVGFWQTPAAVGASYTAHSATSNGTVYMSRGGALTGSADGTEGMVSFWYDPAGTDGVQQTIFQSNNGRVSIIKSTDNQLRFNMASAADVDKIRILSITAYVAATARIHVIASWSTTNNRAQLYVNDVDDADVVTTANDSVAIDYTDTDWGVFWGPGGYPSVIGSIGEFYFNEAESLDLSVASNRRKFVTADLKPVDLGATGSTPTGTAPIIYLKSVYSSYPTNSGSGGNFTKGGAGSFTNGGDFP